MLVDRKDIILVYRQLFQDGVFCIKDDVHKPYVIGQDENGENITIQGLKVIKLLQSLCSRGYVKKTYSWCHFYYTLTDSGLEYLRQYLHLPAGIVPQTLIRENPVAPREERPRFRREDNGERRNFRQNRGGFDKPAPEPKTL